MSKSNSLENAVLELVLNAQPYNNMFADGASAFTDLWVSLHTASPGEGGTQNSNEVGYTGYARVSIDRDGTGWTVTGGIASPNANIVFPTGSGGSGIVTHFAIGAASSGAGRIFYFGTVTPNLATGNGITPKLTTATTITED